MAEYAPETYKHLTPQEMGIESIEGDDQFEEFPVVFEGGDDDDGVLRNGASFLAVRRPEGGWPCAMPSVSKARFYGRGSFQPVRGVAVFENDTGCWHTLRYRNPRGAAEDFADWREREDIKRREEYESKREETERRVAALPLLLRMRLEHFRRDGGDEFRHNEELYELFVCEQAALLASAIPDREEIKKWRHLPIADQLDTVPGWSVDHSGNTFGCAVSMANHLVAMRGLLVVDRLERIT